MYEKGLAYKRRSSVNWCEICKTVLANEQVMSDGTCWRGHADDPGVTQKELEQWFFKITDYAEDLLEWVDKLPGWPERVLTMQRNWIGKSIGAEIHFPLEHSNEVIKVFTTRQDTVFGATFMSLAPEHPLALSLSKGTAPAGSGPDVCGQGEAARLEEENFRDHREGGRVHGGLLHQPDDPGKDAHLRGELRLDGIRDRSRDGCSDP